MLQCNALSYLPARVTINMEIHPKISGLQDKANTGRYTEFLNLFPHCFGSGFRYISSGRLLHFWLTCHPGTLHLLNHTSLIVNVAKILNKIKLNKRFRNSVYCPVLRRQTWQVQSGEKLEMCRSLFIKVCIVWCYGKCESHRGRTHFT